MRLSTKSRYGTRLMLDLAQHHDQGAVQLSEIARRQNISQKYLEQIIKPLKRAGYIRGIRGAKGGYVLARSPKMIRVGEIVSLLEGGGTICECTEDPRSCPRASACLTRALWIEAAKAMFDKLEQTRLYDLVKTDSGKGSRSVKKDTRKGSRR